MKIGNARSLEPIPALFLFPAFWFLCVGLAQIRLLAIQQPWSNLMWAVVVVVPIAYVLGGLLGRELFRLMLRGWSCTRNAITRARRRQLRWLLFACALLGNLEQTHQFIAGGTIPLLSSNIDTARFALPGGPTVILTDLLTVAAVVSLFLPSSLFSREALPELAIASFALLGFAFAGGRGAIIQVVTVTVIARWLYFGRPATRVLVVGVLSTLVFSAGFFYLRMSQHPNDSVGIELREKVYPGMPLVMKPAIPVYLALTTNLEALSRIVDYFSGGAPYGHGAYVTHGFDLFIPAAKDIQEVSNHLSPPWVTSTVAGPLWADGGLPLVAFGTAVIGILVAGADYVARRTREARFILIAANFLFLALFGVYVNLWTQQVDWILITPLLYVFGTVIDGRNPVPETIRTCATGSRALLPTRPKR